MEVLVVEDDADLSELIDDILTPEGYSLAHTVSGLDGVVRVARDRPDIVLLDVDVPDLSGLGAVRAIRDMCEACVVVMSARRRDWQEDALAAGATGCLRKPFRTADIVSMFRAIVDGEIAPPPAGGDVRKLTRGDLERISRMSQAELDQLPFGAIAIDARGIITAYNAYEAAAAQYAQDSVRGREFAELAPCVMVREFTEAIEDGFRTKQLDEVLRFVFPHHGARCVVSVRLYYDRISEQAFIFVSKRTGTRSS